MKNKKDISSNKIELINCEKEDKVKSKEECEEDVLVKLGFNSEDMYRTY